MTDVIQLNEALVSVPTNIGIAIVAPGGYVEDQAAFERAISRLEALGCCVKNYYDHATRFQRFGGTDEARAAQLMAAVSDSDVQIIIALRGGYGTSRLLDMIDYDAIAASGKLLVGHSDLTALQLALLAKTGTASFSGPMICPDFMRDDVSEFTMRDFWQCITQRSHTVSVSASGNPSVNVSGKLWGGNLAMLVHLLGCEYFPNIDGGILCLEDISEHPYRVERMMIQLMRAGVLQKQSAIVLGDFSGYQLNDYDNGYDFEAMINYLRTQLKIPVLAGLPFGHIRDKATLIIGSDAQLKSDSVQLQLTMHR